MRIIVLTPGRTASTTFAKACSHIENYTSGHETKAGKLAVDRIQIPDNHIEIDNRFSWLLGLLEVKYGDSACYVRMHRSMMSVSNSFASRWTGKNKIIPAYYYGVLQFDKSPGDKNKVSEDYLRTVEANIEFFLQKKSFVLDFHLEHASRDFERFWNWIGARGDIEAALEEWNKIYNSSINKAYTSVFKSSLRKLRRLYKKSWKCYEQS